MLIQFQIYRQLPPDPPRMQIYSLEVSPETTILDCLNRIKWEQDGTLAFRKNCRNAICGSCAMRVNGRAALVCQRHVQEELTDGNLITIAPLGNMPVMKDLVVEMKEFWRTLDRVDPYVSTASRQLPEREFLQSPQERQQLNQTSNCILCGACYSDCNAREVNPGFVGPHALAKAQRLIQDNRDDRTLKRIQQHNSQSGVWGCTRCLNCNTVCPMGVEPMDQITRIKQSILSSYRRSGNPIYQASRALRHRQTLVQLVRSGGWVDERRFGVQVVGNQGRDLKGLLSLAPLGARLLAKGKFPFRFHQSAGTSTVQRLIDIVRKVTDQDPDPETSDPPEQDAAGHAEV